METQLDPTPAAAAAPQSPALVVYTTPLDQPLVVPSTFPLPLNAVVLAHVRASTGGAFFLPSDITDVRGVIVSNSATTWSTDPWPPQCTHCDAPVRRLNIGRRDAWAHVATATLWCPGRRTLATVPVTEPEIERPRCYLPLNRPVRRPSESCTPGSPAPDGTSPSPACGART